jgi:hypothetical protein
MRLPPTAPPRRTQQSLPSSSFGTQASASTTAMDRRKSRNAQLQAALWKHTSSNSTRTISVSTNKEKETWTSDAQDGFPSNSDSPRFHRLSTSKGEGVLKTSSSQPQFSSTASTGNPEASYVSSSSESCSDGTCTTENSSVLLAPQQQTWFPVDPMLQSVASISGHSRLQQQRQLRANLDLHSPSSVQTRKSSPRHRSNSTAAGSTESAGSSATPTTTNLVSPPPPPHSNYASNARCGAEDEKDDDDDDDLYFMLNTVDTLHDLDALIADTAARWKTSCLAVAENTSTMRQLQQQPPPRVVPPAYTTPAAAYPSPTSSFPFHSSQLDIIQQQQAEIEALKARLSIPQPQLHQQQHQQQHHHQQHHHQQQEQIDNIPVEHIEVHMDESNRFYEGDDLTVWSGWQSTVGYQPTLRPVRRPDADEASTIQITQQQQPDSEVRVKDYSLKMSAANGCVRAALYSGPVVNCSSPEACTRGSVTGIGVLKFPETGDYYLGSVVQGEMHGTGTYTFFNNSSQKQPRILRGVFEHNVFVGPGKW